MLQSQTRKKNRQPISGVRGFFVRCLGEVTRNGPLWNGLPLHGAGLEIGVASPGLRRRGEADTLSKISTQLRVSRRHATGSGGAVSSGKGPVWQTALAGVAPCPLSNSYPQPGLAVARPYRAHQASIHLRCGDIVNCGNRGKAAAFLQHRLNVPTGHGWAALRMGYSGVRHIAPGLSEWQQPVLGA